MGSDNIIAIDLGKFKSVACIMDGAGGNAMGRNIKAAGEKAEDVILRTIG
jgi:hypothetical protein